ncbi:MAG: NAD-dependent epimerase/dehydratase family protein [Thermoplasmata archaeon]|nr:NAD-dependent epimerase/dehydratase family protein [Thermoplasmata archaeon]
MRVLVTGAAGFLGRGAVRALVGSGAEVRGLVRRRPHLAIVRSDGGEPLLGDVADPTTVARSVSGCDAILHLAAPSSANSRTVLGLTEFVRSRAAGARNLVRAARAQGVPRVVIGSGYWLYGGHRGTITERSTSRNPIAVSYNLGAERAGQAAIAEGFPEVILVRPGMVYGIGAWFLPFARALQDGSYRYIGRGLNHWSPVSLGDSGRAFALLTRKGKAGETYLVVDDEPVQVRTLAEYVAQRLGAPLPRGEPFAHVAAELGSGIARALSANQAASNAKLRALGWKPKYPSYRDGIPPVLRELALSGTPG